MEPTTSGLTVRRSTRIELPRLVDGYPRDRSVVNRNPARITLQTTHLSLPSPISHSLRLPASSPQASQTRSIEEFGAGDAPDRNGWARSNPEAVSWSRVGGGGESESSPRWPKLLITFAARLSWQPDCSVCPSARLETLVRAKESRAARTNVRKIFIVTSHVIICDEIVVAFKC